MANKKQYLKEIGIDLWQSKEASDDACLAETNVESPASSTWQDLEKQALACSLCDLHKTRTNVVFGVGNTEAEIMFIGEAPGANEDAQGEPFVGRAGKLLNAMLQSIGLERADVYIANILKCRPPGNRDPQPQEIKSCVPYLQQQIDLIAPKTIVAVGRVAAQFLLNTTDPMSSLRGQTHKYGQQETPLLVTYHPAYLLRSPREKRKAYTDFLLIKNMSEKIVKN
jgi:uracil-DNA glycosylase